MPASEVNSAILGWLSYMEAKEGAGVGWVFCYDLIRSRKGTGSGNPSSDNDYMLSA